MITATSEKDSVHLNPEQPADTPEQARDRRIRKASDTINNDLWFWQKPSPGTTRRRATRWPRTERPTAPSRTQR